MSKKGDVSMSIIVLAAIALLVLVILSVIFIGRMGRFGEQTGTCSTQGGTCYDGSTCPAGNTKYDLKCGTESQTCCLPIGVS